MAKIIGREVEAGFGVEKVRGTAQLTAEKWIKNTTAYIFEKSEVVNENSVRGVLEDSLNRRVVKKKVEGTLEGIVQVDAIGYLIYNVFGAVSTVDNTGTYTHTFSVAQTNTHASLSTFIKEGAIQQKVFNNSMIGALTINASIDDYLRFNADFIASEGADNTDTPSYDTEYDFIGKDIVFKIADTEGGLAGATATCIKALDITFDQGLIEDYCFGAYNPADINNGKFSIEGTITKNRIDNTFKDLFLSDDSKYMQITITGGTVISGVTYPSITILLNKAMVTDWSESGGADELVEETISFKGFYNATDTESGTVIITNLTSEYDTPVSD